jgi:bifunctional ADP-heptose synthase (sugar kinase/adenylyltransferase)
LDTRDKILTLEAACSLAGPLTIVSGTFDVLRAEHARELAAARQKTPGNTLLAVVRPPLAPVLPGRARAEMAAALRVVDYVVIARDDQDLLELSRTLPDAERVCLEAADARRIRWLREHVRG